ncbi:MAG: Pyruvate dehydrogenase E1 component subunit beta [Chlamydiae bacterium]|nr:Pyruvate dehydrogenase E1 component subunit beta [Chlamydiota bacterium]
MPKETQTINFAEAIRQSLDFNLENDSSVYVMGLGVPDPKGVFGTTTDLHKKHGSNRVMDMPTSENGMTGIAVGSAIMGMKPVMTHQRVDFALLAMDQIVNSAAKWHYMFNGIMQVPMVIRLIVGMGWGQGPQHSQNLHAMFAHFPGLKVVMPTTAYDAKGLLNSSIADPNPVIFIEHRWLYNIVDEVPSENYLVPLGKAKVLEEGEDVTIVSSSYMTIEALKAVKELRASGVRAELIDLRTIKPLDTETILKSVRKTGRLVVADMSWKTLGLASEIITIVVEQAFDDLKCPPIRITLPDSYAPTSWALTNHYYPNSNDIVYSVKKLLGKKVDLKQMILDRQKKYLDVPDKSFTGPF